MVCLFMGRTSPCITSPVPTPKTPVPKSQTLNGCVLEVYTVDFRRKWLLLIGGSDLGTSLVWVGWMGGGGMLTYVALAHISVLRNWCFLHLHISVLRNWCFLHLHTSRCYATDVSCTCKHLGTAQLMFLALARISVLRNWCFLHLHTVVRVSNNVRVSLEQAVDVTWTMDAL